MRDLYFVLIAAFVAVCIGLGLYFFLPSEKVSENETPQQHTEQVSAAERVAFRVIAKESFSSASERKNYIARSEEAFRIIWELAYDGETDTMPEINFEEEQVIGIFDGEHGTGGYDVDVIEVRDTADMRTVRIVRIEPGEGCMTTQAITSPFVIIVLPASSKAPGKEETIRATEC